MLQPSTALQEFVSSLLEFIPQEAAAILVNRLLAEERYGQSHFSQLVAQLSHLVEVLNMPEVWRRTLREELARAREYEIVPPLATPVPIATPLLAAYTSGRLHRVFDGLMAALPAHVPLLAEQALREHKQAAADDWEGIRFLEALLHLSQQGTQNVDNQQILQAWAGGARMREEQHAREQLLPELKQVITEDDRQKLEQRLHNLTTHWQANSNVEVQAAIRLISERLTELDTAQIKRDSMDNTTSSSANQVPAITRLSLSQIALLHIFNRRPVIKDDDRAKELARAHGLKSGTRLHRLYKKYTQPKGITGAEGRQLTHRINDIEKVLAYVDSKYQQDALDKLKQLEIKRN